MAERLTAAKILAAENQGRPTIQIWGSRGMAASMHPEATQAAVDILRQGGDAVDAALALASTLAVTNQDAGGLGGDTVWLLYRADTGQCFHLDGYSQAPAGLTPEWLETRFGLSPESTPAAYGEEPGGFRDRGILVSMVPGTPAAWVEAAAQIGTMPLERTFARAIALAERGFALNRYESDQLRAAEGKLGGFESSRRLFFKPDGALFAEADTLVQKELAETLRRLASGGHAGFYGGRTAEAIIEYSNTHGGVFTAEDLAHYRAVWRPTLSGRYRGNEVVVTGPPTSGAHLLQALNIVESFDMAALGYHSAESLHAMIEACKLARADRRRFAGDPAHVPIPLEKLLAKSYAVARARNIQFGVARCAQPGTELLDADTTHFVVVDGKGNVVSATQTVGDVLFGCGETVAGTGIVMNDRSWWMALRGRANTVGPGRRANIGHSPTLVLSAGRPLMALGSPGGDAIIQFILQTMVNVLDYGFDIQEGIEAPRFRSLDLAFKVGVEKRISQPVRDTLRQWGHDVVDFDEWCSRTGEVEGFQINPKTGNILGGSDPRRNALALGIS